MLYANFSTDVFESTVDKVDKTVADMNEQRELADEIAEAVSNPLGGPQIDEVGYIYNTMTGFLTSF